ncbi:MAG: U32 family peptidase [Clostridiales bacterium]|nr:U32 family peptidase [Clostridiales bacterium]
MSENKNIFKGCELLSPAGSPETLKTALYFGADAVYIGGSFMQMRADIAGFSDEELSNAVELVHSKGKKLYVAANCFARNDEISKLRDYAKFLSFSGVDGVIVSDLGVLAVMKEAAAELPVHISTQANIQNYKTAEVYYNFGAKRVVLGREMTLEQIAALREMTPKELEIECFVHGAMCMSYSGRCLISSFLTGKSGNRGDCTQPCRWMYNIVEEKRPGQHFTVIEDNGSSAILSSHDLNCIEFLDQIALAGVTSFKIEGRMKSPYYVATVTNAYRQRMDGTASIESLKSELECASHRPYSSGFYFGDLKYDHSNDGLYRQSCKFMGIVLEDEGNGRFKVEMRNRFSVGDTLEILSPHSSGQSFKVESIIDKDGNSRETAHIPREVLSIRSDTQLHEGDILRKRIG